MIYIHIVDLQSRVLQAKFEGKSLWVLVIFKGFEHIWAWQPSLSYDMDYPFILKFPLPKDSLEELWL